MEQITISITLEDNEGVKHNYSVTMPDCDCYNKYYKATKMLNECIGLMSCVYGSEQVEGALDRYVQGGGVEDMVEEIEE